MRSRRTRKWPNSRRSDPNPDAQNVRSAYVGMELTGSYAIVPLSILSLIAGLIQALD